MELPDCCFYLLISRYTDTTIIASVFSSTSLSHTASMVSINDASSFLLFESQRKRSNVSSSVDWMPMEYAFQSNSLLVYLNLPILSTYDYENQWTFTSPGSPKAQQTSTNKFLFFGSPGLRFYLALFNSKRKSVRTFHLWRWKNLEVTGIGERFSRGQLKISSN